MYRRDLLRAGVTLVGIPALSGCTEQRLEEAGRVPPPLEPIPKEEVDLSVSQRLAIAEQGIERASGVDILTPDELAGYLRDQRVHVETVEGMVEGGSPILSLSYVVDETYDEGLMHHLGLVAGAYAALVEATQEHEKLTAHLLDPAGDEFGEYEIRRRWARKYNDGTYSARKFAYEAAATATSK